MDYLCVVLDFVTVVLIGMWNLEQIVLVGKRIGRIKVIETNLFQLE